MLRNERLTPAVLQAARTRQLSALVSHAASRVPFYRDLYAAHGISTASFRGLQDLPSLPIVDKRMLRAAGAAAHALDTRTRTTTIRTSGSTGEPYTFKIDHRHDQWRKAQCLRPYLSGGRRLGDKVFWLTASPSHRRPWFSRLGLLREWQFDCASDPALLVEAWQRLAPDVLQGYPREPAFAGTSCSRDRQTPDACTAAGVLRFGTAAAGHSCAGRAGVRDPGHRRLRHLRN